MLERHRDCRDFALATFLPATAFHQVQVVDYEQAEVWVFAVKLLCQRSELRRLYEEARRKYLVFSRFLPTRGDPSGVFDREIINAEVERVAKALQS